MPGSSVHLILIVASAVVPLLGVLVGGWSLREVVVLYWAENVIIGIFQVVRMLTVSPGKAAPGMRVAQLGMVGFFTVHYGLFCLVHGVFVLALTGGASAGGPAGPLELAGIIKGFPGPFWLALALLAANHGWVLIEKWFLNGQWKSAELNPLMAEPYKHIIILHLAILLGAFLAIALGYPIGILVLIVIGKLFLDLREAKQEDGGGFLETLLGRGKKR